MFLKTLKQLNQLINRHAGKLLLLGLARYGWRFYTQWQEDGQKLAQKQASAPLPPLDKWPDLPIVTLLVAAWNEEAYIEGFLSSFRDLDYPNKELILVAGGNDSTFRLARQWASPQITLLEQQAGAGKYRALQRGLQLARGSVIFLTDGDCLLNSESFKRVIYPIITGSQSVVTGLFRPFAHQLSNPFVRAQSTKQRLGEILPSQDPYVPFLVGANSALARSLLEECWSASSNQPIGEDYYLALCVQRAGHQILQVRESYVETRFAESFGEYIRQKSRWHRSWLLLHHQFGDKRWQRNVLSSIKFQIQLAMPLLSLLLGRIGSVTWLLSWAHFFTPYLQAKLLTEPLEEGQKTSLLALLQLMLADFCAWASILPQLLTQKWRERW